MKAQRRHPDELIVGLVSVSDRTSRGAYEDKGLPGLRDWLARALASPWQPHERLVPDERALIEATLVELVDEVGCHLVLTTGGTGPARRLCLLVFSAYYFSQRARAFNLHPLVLIHNPVNHDRVRLGDGIVVHATARDDAGIQRMELWLDDQLIAAQDAPADISATNMTLSKSLFPSFSGTHVITVRAVSLKEGEGQATVMFEVIGPLTGPVTVIVQEGETLESIAADHEVSPEEISASNPDLGPEGPVPGDELVIPDAPIPFEEGEMPGGGDPPPAEDEAPGSAGLFFELLQFAFPLTSSSERTSRRVEMLSLRTWQSFDSLHCYVGGGEGLKSLHGRAASWYAQNGSTDDAVHHYLAAEEYDQAAGLIESVAVNLIVQGQLRKVRTWLEALPDDFIRSRPLLCVCYAWVLNLAGQAAAVERHLRDAERALPCAPAAGRKDIQGLINAVHAYLARGLGDIPASIEYLRQAVTDLAADNFWCAVPSISIWASTIR